MIITASCGSSVSVNNRDSISSAPSTDVCVCVCVCVCLSSCTTPRTRADEEADFLLDGAPPKDTATDHAVRKVSLHARMWSGREEEEEE